MSDFKAHNLLANDDQVNLYFHFITECGSLCNVDLTKSPYSMGDVAQAMCAAAAVVRFQTAESRHIFHKSPEAKAEMKKLFNDTIDALFDDTTIKQFMVH